MAIQLFQASYSSMLSRPAILLFSYLGIVNHSAIQLFIYSAIHLFMICCSSQARELGLASMLLCVVMVFLLCNFPAMVVNILEVNTHNILHPET